MTAMVTVRNATRTPLRLGVTNIPTDGTSVQVDVEDGRVRRDMYRHQGRFIQLEDVPDSEDAQQQIANVTLALTNAMGNWQNPHDVAVIVDAVKLRVKTASTGACGVAVGSTATSATTSSNNLLDAVSVASTGIKSSQDDTDNGTAGVAKGQVVAPGKWVTFTKASGSTTGLVAEATVAYHKLTATS